MQQWLSDQAQVLGIGSISRRHDYCQHTLGSGNLAWWGIGDGDLFDVELGVVLTGACGVMYVLGLSTPASAQELSLRGIEMLVQRVVYG